MGGRQDARKSKDDAWAERMDDWDRTGRQIRRHPWRAIGVVLGVSLIGFAFSWLVMHRDLADAASSASMPAILGVLTIGAALWQGEPPSNREADDGDEAADE